MCHFVIIELEIPRFKNYRIPKSTVGAESIQTPLNCSLFVILQPFANHLSSFFSLIIVHTAPHIDRKTELLTFVHIY